MKLKVKLSNMEFEEEKNTEQNFTEDSNREIHTGKSTVHSNVGVIIKR